MDACDIGLRDTVGQHLSQWLGPADEGSSNYHAASQVPAMDPQPGQPVAAEKKRPEPGQALDSGKRVKVEDLAHVEDVEDRVMHLLSLTRRATPTQLEALTLDSQASQQSQSESAASLRSLHRLASRCSPTLSD